MQEFFVAFSLGEFLQWVLIGFCFAFIFQQWQKFWSEKTMLRNAGLTLFLSVSIGLVIFLVGGSMLTILSFVAFGIGMLLKLFFSAISHFFIDLFLFSRPKHRPI